MRKDGSSVNAAKDLNVGKVFGMPDFGDGASQSVVFL
jgi:hypothetical protein